MDVCGVSVTSILHHGEQRGLARTIGSLVENDKQIAEQRGSLVRLTTPKLRKPYYYGWQLRNIFGAALCGWGILNNPLLVILLVCDIYTTYSLLTGRYIPAGSHAFYDGLQGLENLLIVGHC